VVNYPCLSPRIVTAEKRKKNKRMNHTRVSWLAGLITLALLAACSPKPQETGVFYAATLVPSLTPVTVAVTPTIPADCADDLNFIDDITLRDGSTVKAGSSLDKRWQVQNTGTCQWNEKYSLRRTSGSALGGNERAALPLVEPGNIGVIQILLTAPAEAGTYRTSWRAYNDRGLPFGDPVFIDIIVE